MELCISGEELRKALKLIEQAESQGFDSCLAIFRISQVGKCTNDCLAKSEESIILKAHVFDEQLNYGRVSGKFISDYRFIDGELKEL